MDVAYSTQQKKIRKKCLKKTNKKCGSRPPIVLSIHNFFKWDKNIVPVIHFAYWILIDSQMDVAYSTQQKKIKKNA